MPIWWPYPLLPHTVRGRPSRGKTDPDAPVAPTVSSPLGAILHKLYRCPISCVKYARRNTRSRLRRLYFCNWCCISQQKPPTETTFLCKNVSAGHPWDSPHFSPYGSKVGTGRKKGIRSTYRPGPFPTTLRSISNGPVQLPSFRFQLPFPGLAGRAGGATCGTHGTNARGPFGALQAQAPSGFSLALRARPRLSARVPF